MKGLRLTSFLLIAVFLSEGSIQGMASPQGTGQQATSVPETQDGATITNESIIEMVRAGLASALIVSRINESNASFDLSAKGLIALKRERIPDEVTRAMILRQAPADQSDDLLPTKNSVQTQQPTANEPATLPRLADIRKVFIEPMSDELDQYIIAEISKQLKNRLMVVLTLGDADAIMKGTCERQKGTKAAITGRFLGLHDTAIGTVSITDKDGKVVLWSSEAGDRSIFWGVWKRGGQRKVADRLIHNLKKELKEKEK